MDNIFDVIPVEWAPYLMSFYALKKRFWVIVNIIFAVVVYKDTKGRETKLISAPLWSVVTLFGGVFVAGVYWLTNHTLAGSLASDTSS